MNVVSPQPHVTTADRPARLFADVVFDRPLDHAYTYSVPDELRQSVGVGKRVTCSFGRGEKDSIGYVIRVTDLAPHREVKPISSVLDETALLDDQLLKLTRWMADYYLCGWGQVLHAVVPAGVRDKAGTRNVTFVEPMPKDQQPKLLPSVTAKQKQALERVKREGKPVELNWLAKQLDCTPGVITGLAGKGLIRKFVDRVERLPGGLVEFAPTGTGLRGRGSGWVSPIPLARRDRVGEDGNLPEGD